MNKSILKLFPATLAIAALSSCNTDDLWTLGADSKQEGRSLIVETIDPMADGNITRASMTSGNARYFNANDKLRAYDANLQAYDLYTSKEGNVFTADAGEDIAVENPLNMLFPADMVEYGSWKPETKKFALMKLAMYEDAEEKTDGTLYYSEETTEGTTTYISNLPEFGKISGLEPNLKATAVYLTGYLKIKIENGAKNVSAIRVSSLKEDGVTPNTDMPLWGYFDAVLDDSDMDVKKNTSRFQVSTEKLAAASEEEMKKRAVLTVDLGANQMKQYTSYVFIPIVPTVTYAEGDATGNLYDETKANQGKYPKLKVEYLTTAEAAKTAGEQKWEVLTEYTDKQIKTNTPYSKDADGETMVINGFPIKYEVTSLADIQEALNEAAAIGTDVTVSLDVTEPINIHFSKDESTYKLTVPATLQGQRVLLDCTSSNDKGLISAGTDPDDVFEIEAEEGANGTLAIKGATIQAPIKADLGEVNVELSYDELGVAEKALQFTTPQLTLGNGVEFKNELTWGEDAAVDIVVDGTVTLPTGKSLTTTGDVTINGGETKCAVNAKNVTINSDFWRTITATGKVVANKGISRDGFGITAGSVELNYNPSADITVSGDVAIAAGMNLVKQNGRNVKLTVSKETGDLNITVISAEGAEEVKNPIIPELVINKVSKINATNITIGAIEKKEGTDVTTIHTAGASEITKVPTDEGGLLKFTSEYDGSKTSGTDGNQFGPMSNGRHVYTAAQFAALAVQGGDLALILETDITVKDGLSWTGLKTGNRREGKTVTIDGNGHKISGVKLQGTENVGLFSEITFSGNSTVTVKNLAVEGVSYTAGTAAVENVGALVGKISGEGTVNIQDVTIKGTTSLGTNVKESQNIGSLIGLVDGTTVNLTGKAGVMEVTLTGNIVGHYNLGGTIGCIKDAKVTINDFKTRVANGAIVFDNKDLNLDKLPADRSEYEKYGTVGTVVGSLVGDAALILKGATNDLTDVVSGGWRGNSYKEALHFNYNFKYNESTGIKQEFTGGLAAIGFSPKWGTTESNVVDYFGKKDYTAKEINAYKDVVSE